MLAMMITAPGHATVAHTLHATVAGSGHDVLLTFDVPPGATRIDVSLETSPRAAIELGLFDTRGPGYGSPGFRGIYGPERPTCHVGTVDASPGFRAGPLPAGPWTVLLSVGAAPRTSEATVRVGITSDPLGLRRPDADAAIPPAVRYRAGWYRGDLHAHTEASSDAWASGAALTVDDWAATCRAGSGRAAARHRGVERHVRSVGSGGRGVLGRHAAAPRSDCGKRR
jgi:hypothetical protein